MDSTSSVAVQVNVLRQRPGRRQGQPQHLRNDVPGLSSTSLDLIDLPRCCPRCRP